MPNRRQPPTGLVLCEELGEPPRPAQRAVDSALSDAVTSLHRHRITGADANCLPPSAELFAQWIRATAVFIGSAARSTPTVSTGRLYGGPAPALPQMPKDAARSAGGDHAAVGGGWPAGRMDSMSNSTPSHHPVTVTQLPLVRCAVCRRTVAHRPGQASAALTKHYHKAHPELVGSD
jgi:hypothetical protein